MVLDLCRFYDYRLILNIYSFFAALERMSSNSETTADVASLTFQSYTLSACITVDHFFSGYDLSLITKSTIHSRDVC